jgi:aryl sulfotransferase
MPVQPARREYRTWIADSRRWQHYRPRFDDIVIATYPKCGTTWMQRIVGLLVFQTPEARPVMQISAWIDRRIPESIEAVVARIEAQDHRRFLKTHLPADGLPIYDEIKYVHVARDGRDACISFHNHQTGFGPEMLQALDRVGLDDETIGRPHPRLPADSAAYFHRWLTESAVPGHEDGLTTVSFFRCERTWWELRHRPNLLLVHFNDLKADLSGEMRRVADFLGITVEENLLPALVEAAKFDAMRRDGAALMGRVAGQFQGGADRFFHKGTNERWRGVFDSEDVSLFEAKAAELLSPVCARWLSAGRLEAGDPRLTAD